MLGQPGRDPLQRQLPGPARGQFDGQREAVQPAAQLGHRTGVPGGQRESRHARLGPRDEQPHRVGSLQFGQVALGTGFR